MEDTLYYDFSVTPYKRNSKVVIDTYCNSATIVNIGTTLMLVNGIPLNPGTPGTNNGETYLFGGNRAEIFKGRIDISFPAAGIGSCLVVQKYYVNYGKC